MQTRIGHLSVSVVMCAANPGLRLQEMIDKSPLVTLSIIQMIAMPHFSTRLVEMGFKQLTSLFHKAKAGQCTVCLYLVIFCSSCIQQLLQTEGNAELEKHRTISCLQSRTYFSVTVSNVKGSCFWRLLT